MGPVSRCHSSLKHPNSQSKLRDCSPPGRRCLNMGLVPRRTCAFIALAVACRLPSAAAFSAPATIATRLNHDRRPVVAAPSTRPRLGAGAGAQRAAVIRRAGMGPAVVAGASTSVARRVLRHGVTTFLSDWKAYCAMPLVAGFVGW